MVLDGRGVTVDMDFVTPCKDARANAMRRCEISDIVERVGHKS